MNIIYRMFIHDFLYVLADQLIKKYNPCQIEPSSDGLVRCMDDIEICCNGCKHLRHNGCSVTALLCKLNLCREAEALDCNAHLLPKLHKAESIARHYSLLDFRASRQRIYKHLRKASTNLLGATGGTNELSIEQT